MAGTRRGPAALFGSAVNDDVVVISEPSPTKMAYVESVRTQLRQRWELASVLNFLHVFQPIIGKDLKLSAEDIETAIIEQNSTLAQLHIALLKGILPASQAQTLKSSDAWMVALSKTLSMWWPWVAEGNFPLTGAKGEEISIYKELEPTARVVILKALCEVRADQYDAASYINEKMKNGTEVSYFRKDKLASDGNGVSFWYDGSETIGHRLYKEVHFKNKKLKYKGAVPEIHCQWETLATNLEEFNNIVNELSSSEFKWEVALSKSVEINVIPVLEKQWKKKQRAQHRQQREQLLWNGFRNSIATRSCRNNKHVDYKFDSYDKAITEAIKYANKRKTSDEQIQEEKPSHKRRAPTSNGSNSSATASSDGESTETGRSNPEGSDDANDSNDEEYVEQEEDDGKKDGNGDEGNVHCHKQNMPLVCRSKGLRFSKRLAGVPGHTIPESVNLGLKNRLRQRPSVNTAVEQMVVLDSEDESSQERLDEDSRK
ncbi:hypothetical protein C2S53_012550 [Perilla frutescens var. hirtella]|uniref:DDT domain-containing protein DDR4 n=1 Tax=Perilla frutescens var. hirtella TaxID=608512 RepID=A0AAD4PDF3_PERFH|nr:hypothetical protein C2S53_012550 [Perilla frutescens var. hirtella]